MNYIILHYLQYVQFSTGISHFFHVLSSSLCQLLLVLPYADRRTEFSVAQYSEWPVLEVLLPLATCIFTASFIFFFVLLMWFVCLFFCFVNCLKKQTNKKNLFCNTERNEKLFSSFTWKEVIFLPLVKTVVSWSIVLHLLFLTISLRNLGSLSVINREEILTEW